MTAPTSRPSRSGSTAEQLRSSPTTSAPAASGDGPLGPQPCRPRRPPPSRRRSAVAVAVATACAVLLAGCAGRQGVRGAPADVQTGSTERSIVVDGVTRTWRTHVPGSLSRSRPVPLVVMLHGGFGSADQAESAYGWDAAADDAGFVVAYPDGLHRAWNAGTCCGAPSKEGTDDVAFIEQVVRAEEAARPIDPTRVFATGMSNGAMMAERLACETTVFRAVAPVAGAQMVPCDRPAPISVLHIHGAADTRVPMDGSPGNGRGNVPAHPPIADTIAAWERVDGCEAPTTTVDGPVTTVSASCPADRAVELITVAGAGHQWPGSARRRPIAERALGIDPPSQALDATRVIWDFFAARGQG